MDCVVDTSVGVKTIVREVGSDQARAIFAGLAADPPAEVFVPELFFAECGNALWKEVRRYGFSVEMAQVGLRDLIFWPLVRVPASLLLPSAFELALAHEITVYDATYAALAHITGLPLVTADDRLVRKLAGGEVTVVGLADL